MIPEAVSPGKGITGLENVHPGAAEVVWTPPLGNMMRACYGGPLADFMAMEARSPFGRGTWTEPQCRGPAQQAVKCCTDLVVLRTLNSLGAEIETVIQLGVTPERIIFANPIKSVEHLDYARRNNVTLMTFDSADELDKIRDNNVRLLLRIQGNSVGCGITMNNKFGCSLADAGKVLRKARCRNLNIAGVS
ncbi:hypothetical protein HPB50_006329 [Hyalomma asiaticum]|uniref:Uncharacterized protein n=1 Tax=Hyalomma asiaticum TaxID=266040 RepID=A0ACB7TCS5_HYAAI|nr:hypothetical protein HPB50_006329 [Hyalomma asiaticum]